MLRAAGMYGKDFPLKVIIAVNNPFDLNLAIEHMRGTGYEKNLADDLIRSLVSLDHLPAEE